MTENNSKIQVAIYARVSTKGKQDVENQLRELRRWAKKMGYKIHQEYVDEESGGRGRGERKEFSRMFKDASKRHYRERIYC